MCVFLFLAALFCSNKKKRNTLNKYFRHSFGRKFVATESRNKTSVQRVNTLVPWNERQTKTEKTKIQFYSIPSIVDFSRMCISFFRSFVFCSFVSFSFSFSSCAYRVNVLPTVEKGMQRWELPTKRRTFWEKSVWISFAPLKDECNTVLFADLEILMHQMITQRMFTLNGWAFFSSAQLLFCLFIKKTTTTIYSPYRLICFFFQEIFHFFGCH